MKRKKNILILNTGGTISSIKTSKGYEPAQGYVAQMLRTLPFFSNPDMPNYTILEYEPLLDSSNVTLTEWNRIASDIMVYYDQVDGFVILHGTDTMAYTASALSFMLEHLGKPVILTGSQIPLSQVRNDALDNVITSLLIATNPLLHEVCIYFNQKLLRGNRARKVSSSRFDAFDSPNFPHLATLGVQINLNNRLLLPAPEQSCCYQPMVSQCIGNFRLYPGGASDMLARLLQQPIKALVLETYGSGNAQNNDPDFLDSLRDAVLRDIVIVNCSQCPHGGVEMGSYATGYTLKKAGLLSGHDMTPETVHSKLLYLFSKYSDLGEIKYHMELNLVGELTETQGDH
ncbi:MAG: asparaginase [Legionellaceae bacterium]